MSELTFNDYQQAAHSTAIYPPENGLEYLVSGLTGEAGEVAGKAAKFFRGDGDLDKEALAKEVGDVLWFIAELSYHLGVPMEDVAQANLDKLASRKARGTLKGNGDNR